MSSVKGKEQATSQNNPDTAHSNDISSSCAMLSISDEEDEGYSIGEDDIPIQNQVKQFILVGRLLTEKSVKFNIMKETLAAIWRPGKGMSVQEVEQNLFLFQFYNEKDMKRILEDGPWSYEQSLLLLKQMKPHESPMEVQLSTVAFWVQVHNLPWVFVSEKLLKAIGDYVGGFIHTDTNALDGNWKVFLRIRVTIDVSKPIRRRMKLKKPGGEVFWVEFKYERLPTFCFVCGIIGHNQKFCPKQFETEVKALEKPFGAWLRASGRRQQNGHGQKWLISGETRRTEKYSAEVQGTDRVGGVESRGAGLQGDNKEYVQCSGSTGTEHVELISQKQPDNPDCQTKTGVMGQTSELVQIDNGPLLVDQKRRRRETERDFEEPTSPSVCMIIDGAESKNLSMAGLVMQARQEQ